MVSTVKMGFVDQSHQTSGDHGLGVNIEVFTVLIVIADIPGNGRCRVLTSDKCKKLGGL